MDYPGYSQKLHETAADHSPMGKSHLIPLQVSTGLPADSFSAPLKFPCEEGWSTSQNTAGSDSNKYSRHSLPSMSAHPACVMKLQCSESLQDWDSPLFVPFSPQNRERSCLSCLNAPRCVSVSSALRNEEVPGSSGRNEQVPGSSGRSPAVGGWLLQVSSQPRLLFLILSSTPVLCVSEAALEIKVSQWCFSVYPSPWSCHSQESVATQALPPRMSSFALGRCFLLFVPLSSSSCLYWYTSSLCYPGCCSFSGRLSWKCVRGSLSWMSGKSFSPRGC